ncbi:hypothetical protein T492DRAFT_851309 [Pavlovales sp. CCMP2436]|nr:hypothetical protein T492DRAFT_851309 [Pavlovales sp. CCMP2436]
MAAYLEAMAPEGGAALAAEAQARYAAERAASTPARPPALPPGLGGAAAPRCHATEEDDDVDAKYGGGGARGAKATRMATAAPVDGRGRGGGARRRGSGGGGGSGKEPQRDLSTFDAALLPGRRPCGCNASRHELLYNCLSCGNIVCMQQGPGDCLSCGNDPHECAPSLLASAALATAHRDKLLGFERSGAKRTSVIDDQTDYWDTTGDAWLSAPERDAAMQKR